MCAMSQFDLVLKSGQVFDPDSGLFQQRDVAISDGQVVSVGDDV
ncbi:MAG: hypothetical protein JWR35_3492, partial [Marmoricola sp.]|nr:hypothetical protein [Marmoricola sp.]